MKTLPPKKPIPFSHRLKQPSVLPGFGLSIGFTIFYLTIIVLIPLSSLFFKISDMSFSEFFAKVTSPNVVHSYKITFGCSFIAALVNCFFGLIVAWVLTRYKFPGKRFMDAIIDLPFALPTAVAGIALTTLYAKQGWIGQYIDPEGAKNYYAPQISAFFAFAISLASNLLVVTAAWVILSSLARIIPALRELRDNISNVSFILPFTIILSALIAIILPWPWIAEWATKGSTPMPVIGPKGIVVAYTPIGITIALIFVGLPFIVRTVQPVLQDMERETEEGAASLGASRWQVFHLVILPNIRPALLTGFALAFARALGEYGSVLFIAGNMPGFSQITPQFIVIQLDQYDYSGAAAIAIVMLAASFVMLLVINILQRMNKGRLSP